KEYSGQFKTIKDAYDAVQEKVEKGIELTQDEILILEHGSSAMDTFTAAQGDATTQAGLAAIANARLVQAQWKLNEAIKNGAEDLAPYAQEVEDAKKWAEEMGVATDGNTEAQNIFAEALEGVVAKLRDLFVELGLLPPLE